MAKSKRRFLKVEMAVDMFNFIYAFKVCSIFSKSQICLLVYITHNKKTELKLQIFFDDVRNSPKNSVNEDLVLKLCLFVTLTVLLYLKSFSQSMTLKGSSGNQE